VRVSADYFDEVRDGGKKAKPNNAEAADDERINDKDEGSDEEE